MSNAERRLMAITEDEDNHILDTAEEIRKDFETSDDQSDEQSGDDFSLMNYKHVNFYIGEGATVNIHLTNDE